MADPEEILLNAEEKMDGAVQALRRELSGVRTGRAHPSLIESLPVEYYGATTPLEAARQRSTRRKPACSPSRCGTAAP